MSDFQTLHPKAAAGTPGGIGGQFVPNDAVRQEAGQIVDFEPAESAELRASKEQVSPTFVSLFDDEPFDGLYSAELDKLVETGEDIGDGSSLYDAWGNNNHDVVSAHCLEEARRAAEAAGVDFDEMTLEDQEALVDHVYDTDTSTAYTDRLDATHARLERPLCELAGATDPDEVGQKIIGTLHGEFGVPITPELRENVRVGVAQELSMGPVEADPTIQWDASMGDFAALGVNREDSRGKTIRLEGASVALGDTRIDVPGTMVVPASGFDVAEGGAAWRDGGVAPHDVVSPLDDNGLPVNKDLPISTEERSDGSVLATFANGSTQVTHRSENGTFTSVRSHGAFEVKVRRSARGGYEVRHTKNSFKDANGTEVMMSSSSTRRADGTMENSSVEVHNGVVFRSKKEEFKADGSMVRTLHEPHRDEQTTMSPSGDVHSVITHTSSGNERTITRSEERIGSGRRVKQRTVYPDGRAVEMEARRSSTGVVSSIVRTIEADGRYSTRDTVLDPSDQSARGRRFTTTTTSNGATTGRLTGRMTVSGNDLDIENTEGRTGQVVAASVEYQA